MKNLIIIASLLLSLPIMAQTKVVKKNAVKANNFGITYSLPKTSLVVDAEVTKVTCKAGPYYKYAEKYLGVKDAITEDKVYYELGKISLVNKGVPDADNTFIVEFCQKSCLWRDLQPSRQKWQPNKSTVSARAV